MSRQHEVKLVLLVGAEGDAPAGGVLGSESTPLAKLLGESAGAIELKVVSFGTSRVFAKAAVHLRLDQHDRSLTDRLLTALGAFALRERLANFPIGRLLESIGPIARSRVFWRTLKRNPEAIGLLRTSDVAIATDLETTKAAWIAVHRGWVDDAYYDHRAVAIAFDSLPPAP
jgi:hypothetical protein